MKLHSFISILFLSLALFSCSNDDEKQAGDSGNPDNTDISSAKVDNYVVQPYNDDAYVEDIMYLENGNNAKFTYASPYLIEYTESAGGNYPNGEPRLYVQFQLDSNKRVTTIVSRPQLNWSYRYVFTYNSDNYIDEMKIYETILTNEGHPQNEERIYQENKMTWENENLVKRNIKSYHNGEFSSERDLIYSGFFPENVNTLGTKNFGFDIFGEGGFPLYFLGGGNHHAYFTDVVMFAGKQIPTQMVEDVLSTDAPDRTTNYKIVKDAQGRIKELKTEDGPTWWQNRIYTYED